MPHRKKVFISSTYSDLVHEREEVWDSLQRLNIDILGMEQFGARTPTSLETCIYEVNQSDIYVGIIGMRYGSVDENGKSYTELEYEAAVKGKKEILIYLIDEKRAYVIPANIDFKYSNQLIDFKKHLKANHTIDNFANKEQLASKLANKLITLGVTKTGHRPPILKAKIHRFQSSKENLLFVIAYQFEKPYEIYIGTLDDDFYIPKYVREGEVIEHINQDGNKRMDLRYKEEEFSITIEGLSRFNNAFNTLFTELLKNDVPIEVIINAFKKINLEELNLSNDLKESLNQIFFKK